MFNYTLVCHDPIENEDLNLLNCDDRSRMLRIMKHRRNIDGDLYAYHIEVREEVNSSQELRLTDNVAKPFVALLPGFDENGRYYDEIRCTGGEADEYANLGYEVYFDPRIKQTGIWIPVAAVPVNGLNGYNGEDDLPF